MEDFGVQASSGVTTLLFTDIEGSTRLWEQEGARMSRALAEHDALSRKAVEENRGVIVKMTGDGMYAAFGDPLDALTATTTLQQSLAGLAANNHVPLRVRAGLHLGIVERRDDDLFGSPVNRAARIMKAAHGGQVLLSQAVVECRAADIETPPDHALRAARVCGCSNTSYFGSAVSASLSPGTLPAPSGTASAAPLASSPIGSARPPRHVLRKLSAIA
jgi:class 3 adenylate cyclase